MADYKETRIVRSRMEPSRGAAPWLAFLVGALLIAMVAMFFVNAHGRISGPAGSVDLNISPPATAPTAPAPHAPAPPAR
jgi:hypothetical protein